MVELQYFGHSFFSLKDKNGTVLIDPISNSSKFPCKKLQKIPAKIKSMKNISLILLTNELEEHFDKKTIEELSKKNNAIVVAHDSLLTQLSLPRNLKASVNQGSEIFLKGYKISTKTAHCPLSFCPTGYLIEADGKKIYHAGSTHLLESFSDIGADVAILPMNTRSMDIIDVVRAAKIIKPKKLIPMQHDTFDLGQYDTKDLARRIKESVLDTETVVLQPGKKVKV